MKKILIVFVCLFFGLIAVFNIELIKSKVNFFNNLHIYTAEEQNEINSSDKVEFIYLEQEQKDIARWKNKTMDDLINDALSGDRVALYNLGEYSFLGLADMMLNVQAANYYFARSASLGFAPALNNIAQIYLDEESNLFLGIVYINLVISFGHTEFIQIYHHFRKTILAEFGLKNGKKLLNEIERIAAHKKNIILKNQKLIRPEPNLLNNITDEDYQYDCDYWEDIYHGNNEGLNFFKIKEFDDEYLNKLHAIYYQIITSDDENFNFEILKIVDDMKKDSYSQPEIEMLQKRAKYSAKKNYKLVSKMENDAKEAEKNLKILEEYEKNLKTNLD